MRSVVDNAVVVGTGQIGTYIARELARSGLFVHAVDLRPDPAFFHRYGPPPDRARLEELDILDGDAVQRLFVRIPTCRAVVLCAGLSGRRILADPEAARRLYIDGTTHVVAAARATEARRLVLVSSLAVYGRRSGWGGLAEATKTDPSTDYGAVVRAAELVVASAGTGLPRRLVVRCAGVFGPNRFGLGSHSARFMERLVYSAARDQPIRIEGTLEDCDDYIYVKDLGSGIARIATEPLRGRASIFNLGTGATSTLSEVIAALRCTFPEVRVEVVSPPGARPRRRAALDVRRIERCVGFRPRFRLAEAIADYAATVGLVHA